MVSVAENAWRGRLLAVGHARCEGRRCWRAGGSGPRVCGLEWAAWERAREREAQWGDVGCGSRPARGDGPEKRGGRPRGKKGKRAVRGLLGWIPGFWF